MIPQQNEPTDLVHPRIPGHMVSAVWLRRIDNKVDVLVEIGGEWYLVIREVHDSYFGHIMELKNYSLENLKPDPLRAIDEAQK